MLAHHALPDKRPRAGARLDAGAEGPLLAGSGCSLCDVF